MYANKFIVKKMILLLKEKPFYRDNRMKAVERIILDNNYRLLWGKCIKDDCKTAFDIDRTFRYVQQHVPSLRGNNWLKRQRMAGEISEDEYREALRKKKQIKQICIQLDIQFN